MRVVTIEHVSIFGTWFPFHQSYRIEGLDDQDYEPRISSNRFRRQVALENKLAQEGLDDQDYDPSTLPDTCTVLCLFLVDRFIWFRVISAKTKSHCIFRRTSL